MLHQVPHDGNGCLISPDPLWFGPLCRRAPKETGTRSSRRRPSGSGRGACSGLEWPVNQELSATLDTLTDSLASWIWSVPLFLLVLGCGLVFSIISKFVQWRILTHGYSCIRGHYDKPEDTGHINHFQALCAALSATIGLGNIGGVALAVSVGGPGAVFWMWIIGLFGMALKFMECSLAVMFRDVRDVPDPSAPALEQQDAEERTLEYAGEAPPEAGAVPRARGEVRGGPMWYIQKGLVDPTCPTGSRRTFECRILFQRPWHRAWWLWSSSAASNASGM